jgi:hypothetical protein
MLVDGDNSAAGFLQSFAMAMYARAAYPMDSNGLRNLDDKHMQIFQDMAASYRRHGEGDPDFVDVCKAIKAKRAAYGLRIKAHLDEIRACDRTSSKVVVVNTLNRWTSTSASISSTSFGVGSTGPRKRTVKIIRSKNFTGDRTVVANMEAMAAALQPVHAYLVGTGINLNGKGPLFRTIARGTTS